MVKDYVWTSEKLAEKSLETVKMVRERAIAKANNELLVLCDNEIARRSPPKKPASQLDRKGQPVRGFHFVCKRDRGVVHNPDGTSGAVRGLLRKNTPSALRGTMHT
jgi:hypothetical protein